MTLNEIKHKFSISKPYTQLIYINIAVFIIVAIVNIVVTLGSFRSVGFSDVLQLSSDFSLFTKPFWTIISYMFVHISLLHLFFNMICLYWFGQLFLMSFTGKQLIGIYILGGILGGVVYMLSYNYIPFFEGKISLLSGASASIIAIIVATALDMPNMPIRLLLVGSVRLKWLAVITVLISVLGITSNNAGGEIAHIGGALAGWLWFVLLKRNINIIKPINYIISAIVNFFSSKPRLKKDRRRAKYHYVKSDEQYNMEQKQNNRNLDAILDKIRQSGYNSLTEDEKKQLFDISRKI